MGSGQRTTTAGTPSPVRSAYIVGLEDALHIAQQETTKSDILAAIKGRIAEFNSDRRTEPPSRSTRSPEPGEILPLMDMPEGSTVEVDMPKRFTVWGRSPNRDGKIRIEYFDNDGEGSAWVDERIEAEFIERDPKAKSWLKERIAKDKAEVEANRERAQVPRACAPRGRGSDQTSPSATSAPSVVNNEPEVGA